MTTATHPHNSTPSPIRETHPHLSGAYTGDTYSILGDVEALLGEALLRCDRGNLRLDQAGVTDYRNPSDEIQSALEAIRRASARL